jgi:hypothetical protein
VLFVPKQSSFKLAVVLGIKEGSLYRLRSQPMRVVASSSRETDEEEQEAPPVVRRVAPPIVRQAAPPVA